MTLFDELRLLASTTEEFHAFEVPDVETRLWDGVSPHPDWREADLPWRDMSGGMGPYVCEECHHPLSGLPSVLWQSPHAKLRSAWEQHGVHLVCPS